ncbi:MAG TPA: hypothetical protein ENK53_08870 [Thiotrichales bacterium]|nr:hypothetical protein [Thiotrichales bacterium]
MVSRSKAILYLGLGTVFFAALILYLSPREGARREITDLPWQVEVLPDGSHRVFGLVLGRATFADAVARFGEPEAVALFVSAHGQRSLEAYFGKRNLGGLEARIITVLRLPAALAVPHDRGEPQPSGAIKYAVPRASWPELARQPIQALTYSPAYSGLDEAYLVTRFGPPGGRYELDDGRVRLEYPAKGITLHLDPHGREVFEYRAPQVSGPESRDLRGTAPDRSGEGRLQP